MVMKPNNELWEIKFLGYLRLHKLYDVILAKEEPKEGNVEKNIDAFAQLIQCLDDRSLSLVMRDAKEDGRKPLKILRNHYIGKSKPHVLALYTELTSLHIELADGRRASGVVSAKGRAKIILHDVEGVAHEVFLEGALYIPSYRQNIFSVQSAINKGSAVNLTPNSVELSAPDGTKFSIKKRSKLYYLNSTISSSGAHTAETSCTEY